MRVRHLLAAATVLLCGASASAQTVSVAFEDGRVRLSAENAPVSRILAEWARVGGTTIVNGERIPGAPVTLQLLDVPERQALDIVLRGAAGYMVAARETRRASASFFDRILILPTTARVANAPAPAPQAAQPAPPPFVDDRDTQDLNDPEDGAGQTGPPAALGRLIRGRVQSELAPPGAQEPRPDGGPAQRRPQIVAPPASPFGIFQGSTRPGVIATPPRDPDDDSQPR